MLEMLFAAALLTPGGQEASPPDGRGWTIQCAVMAKYLREDAVVGLSDAEIDRNAVAIVRRQAEVDRLDAVYQVALAAPSNVEDMTERFALARRFRDEAYGMEDNAREDVIASCEVVLGLTPAASR